MIFKTIVVVLLGAIVLNTFVSLMMMCAIYFDSKGESQ